MIDLMKRFFGKSPGADSTDRGGEGPHDIRVATCALFLEMASIDGEFSDVEREAIVSILKEDHDLSDENTDALLEAAKKELDQSIDLWQFTNRINQNYTREEKIRVIEMVWKIVYTDGKLDKHEDYLVHKLATLLRLEHRELIDAKLKMLHSDR